MPPKRKAGAPVYNSGSKYSKQTTGKAKRTTGYSKYGYDKSGKEDADMVRAVKAAEIAAARQVSKNIETQYSQALFTMSQDMAGMKGPKMGLLNTASGGGFDASACMVFNLCYLSQVGSNVSAGYRQGQKINALGLNVSLDINLPQQSVDCSYHWQIIRRKNDAPNQHAYSTPEITTMAELGLFKPLTDGPWANTAAYLGTESLAGQAVGIPTSPMRTYASAMRRNVSMWTFVSGAGGSTNMYAKNVATPSQNGPESLCTTHFNGKLYHALNETWEFVDRGGSNIKGGNYFFVLWREGPVDFSVNTNADVARRSMGGAYISTMIELSYKDG